MQTAGSAGHFIAVLIHERMSELEKPVMSVCAKTASNDESGDGPERSLPEAGQEPRSLTYPAASVGIYREHRIPWLHLTVGASRTAAAIVLAHDTDAMTAIEYYIYAGRFDGILPAQHGAVPHALLLLARTVSLQCDSPPRRIGEMLQASCDGSGREKGTRGQ